MDWLQLSFDRPWFLLLLLFLPVIWFTGRQSLADLGRFRYFTALAFRSLLVALLVCALAEIQLVRISQRIVALFLIDQSSSVAPLERQQAFAYADAAVRKHRDAVIRDEAGVIVFGAAAQIEHAPAAVGGLPKNMESELDPARTNLASALRLAKASFPAGVGKRVVILSDGNQNVGDALIEASDLAADGVGIDVAPLAHGAQGDIVVERVIAPSGARIGAAFDVQVVVDYRLPPASEFQESPPSTVSGKLVVFRKAAGHTQIVGEDEVTLRAGKQLFQFRQQLDEAAFYTYDARFVPTDARLDHYSQNNAATAFTHLQGRGRVLLIVSAENPEEFAGLATVLRKHEIDVTVQPTNALFGTLDELQNYDCVVLGNVGRMTPVAMGEVQQFTDQQIALLVKNVEQLGAGLVMIGGPDSFGAGGWEGTELEKALPVDMTVKNSKVSAVGALMLVIDKSGSMAGDKLELSKAAAIAAAGALGPLDYIGVIAFDDGHEEVVTLQKVGGNLHKIKERIKRLGPGGGTNMQTGIKRGYDQLLRSKASTKHLIVLTDGQTAGSGYGQQASDMKKKDITTTSVAIGADAARPLLQEMSNRGGGKYYQTTSPKAIPKIIMQETRRVVRPLIFEPDGGLVPIRQQQHEILGGISGNLPPITGYVLTTLKENPLVEAPLLAPLPGSPNNTILATWTYGAGRTVAFTTDAGQRWSSQWNGWEGHDKLYVQMIRWAMRPLLDQGNFVVNAHVRDGELDVSVQAITPEGDFLNNLPLKGNVISGDSDGHADLVFEQVGPGRYRARAPLEKAGSYLVGIQPGPGQGVLRTGVNVPYSAEYKDTTTNEPLLVQLASLKPAGGKAGELIRLPEETSRWSEFSGPNIYRRELAPGRSLTSVWPVIVMIAGCLFFFDVLNRRVQFPWESWATFLAYLRRQAPVEVATPRIDRLQEIKQQARNRMPGSDRQWKPPTPEPEAATPTVVQSAAPQTSTESNPATSREASPLASGDDEEYSDRLLRRMRELRNKPKE